MNITEKELLTHYAVRWEHPTHIGVEKYINIIQEVDCYDRTRVLCLRNDGGDWNCDRYDNGEYSGYSLIMLLYRLNYSGKNIEFITKKEVEEIEFLALL